MGLRRVVVGKEMCGRETKAREVTIRRTMGKGFSYEDTL